MSRNGAGVYSLPSGNPVVTGTVISSTWGNNTLSDIATALTQSLASDGQTTPTANLPMGSFKHTNIANASSRTDYAAYGQIQDGSPNYVATIGGTADVITLTPSPAITAYMAGQIFRFIASGANTTNVTVNISGLGATALTKRGSTALVANDIPSGAIIEILYDGTRFQLLNIWPTLSTISGTINLGTQVTSTLPVANGGTSFNSYTTGDIVYASSSSALSKLGIGSATQVLIGGSIPAWGIVPINGLTEDTSPDATADYAITYDASASTNKKVKLQNIPQSSTGGASLTYLSTVTATGSATNIEYTGIDDTYGALLVRCEHIYAASAGGKTLLLQFGDGGGYFTSSYQYHVSDPSQASTSYGAQASGSASGILIAASVDNTSTRGLNGHFIINRPGATGRHGVEVHTWELDNSNNNRPHVGSGDYTGATTAITKFRIITGDGSNLGSGGIMYVYGLKKS